MKLAEVLNAADAKTKVRDQPPGRILEALVLEDQRRFLARSSAARQCNTSMPPNVLKHLETKRDDFVKSMFVSIKFQDPERTVAVLTLGASRTTRMVRFVDGGVDCECGNSFLDDSPCGCALFAADKAGIVWSSLLHPHDSASTWKDQYDNLTNFVVPGSAQLREMTPDSELLAPAVFPIKPGRPSNKRKKGITEGWKSSKRKAKMSKLQASSSEF